MTTTPVFAYGASLTGSADALRPVSLAEVFTLVTTDAALQQLTVRLRSLLKLDREAYRTAKTRLPYIVGSWFGPDAETGAALRRTTLFEEAHYLILDLDQCTGLNGQVPDAVRQDEYVALAFVSPSGTGLKVVFRLLDACPDPKLFQIAYRAFAEDWAGRNRWASGLDLRTSDVTRACFLAHDPTAYYNPDAMPVDWQRWVAEAGELPLDAPVPARRPAEERPINELAYQRVLQQVNPNTHTAGHRTRPVEKQLFVPELLHTLEPDVRALCDRFGWTLQTVQPLNYGLKFAIRQGLQTAEVNVFWGKRGFSVVRSPKTGTDPALSDRLYEQVFALLFPAQATVNVPVDLFLN